MLFIDVSLYKRELFRILALAAAFQDLEALIRGPLPMAGMVHIRHASLLGGCFFHVGDWDRPWGPQLVGVGRKLRPLILVIAFSPCFGCTELKAVPALNSVLCQEFRAGKAFEGAVLVNFA